MVSKAGDCSCLTGTAVVDGNGNCRCVNDSGSESYPAMTTNAPVRTPQVHHYYGPVVSSGPGKSTPEPAATIVADSDNTILGMPPLVALGLGAAALYFMSQMGDNKKQKQ